jgi:hypothetical protein
MGIWAICTFKKVDGMKNGEVDFAKSAAARRLGIF